MINREAQPTLTIYADVVAILKSLYAELYETRAQESTTRADAYLASPQSSPSGRESDARAAVAHLSASALTLEGEIRANELTLQYLDRVLVHLEHDRPGIRGSV